MSTWTPVCTTRSSCSSSAQCLSSWARVVSPRSSRHPALVVGSTPVMVAGRRADRTEDAPVESPLLTVPPAEVGLLLQRRSHPRLVGAALLGLAGRGLLRVECTSPNRFQVEPSWHLEVVDDDGGDGPTLRSHEERLLEAVRRLVSRRTGTRREVRDLDDVDELRGSSGGRARRAGPATGRGGARLAQRSPAPQAHGVGAGTAAAGPRDP
ncbi:MAG: hypothetical protein PGN11_11255 [Quadrisphaera sp.]